MATRRTIVAFLSLFYLVDVIQGDPGRDLCKIVNSGLKCSKISSKYFPYDTFVSFNDDLTHFTTEMKYLEVVHSNISVLQASSFQQTPYLSQIILSNIVLMEIEPGAFGGLKRLKLVDLSYNLLQTIPDDVFKYTKLNVLNLEGNALLEIPTNEPILQAKFLTSLSLKKCNIQHLPGSAFQQNPALIHLDLSQNYLKMLPKDIFASLQHLTFVNLSGNQFRTMDVQVFEAVPSFPRLPGVVILSDNPWTCDCKISKLADWLTKNLKTGSWSETPEQCRLKKLVECQQPKRISWNTQQFKELMASC